MTNQPKLLTYRPKRLIIYLVPKTEMSNQEMYRDGVFKLLEENKNRPLTNSELQRLQLKIEENTMKFDEESIYKSYPNMIRLLLRENECNAKDYLKGKKNLEKEDSLLLNVFGQYTIEGLIIDVLGKLFNKPDLGTSVRVSTLTEQLDSSVRLQASLLKSRIRQEKREDTDSVMNIVNPTPTPTPTGKKTRKKKDKLLFPFGKFLVEFMESRDLIELINLQVDSIPKKKKDNYMRETPLYALCKFDISLLPIKLNLPMICKPLDWKRRNSNQQAQHLSDLTGGYLSTPTNEMYDRYRLLSSADINHFYIDINGNEENLCRIMNSLQNQPFIINSDFLQRIYDNYEKYADGGLLMPRFLVDINFSDVSRELRIFRLQYDKENKYDHKKM